MSGDVQPRKRKDKKRKKDELGIEEPRGTAAALGEGDVFMHSYHDHGTGGHWCAKIIFFSLLAVLITLIGLIILENRGLSELEANAVKSQYSGVFEGWLEDAPDDDHHDEHTLELKHHDDEEEEDHGFHDDDEISHEDHEDEDQSLEDHLEDHDLEEAEEEGAVRSFFGKYFGGHKDDEGIEDNEEEAENLSYEEDNDENPDEQYEQNSEEEGDQNYDEENDEDDEDRDDEEVNEPSFEQDDEENDEEDEERDDDGVNEPSVEQDDEENEGDNDLANERDDDDRTEEENDEVADSTEKFDDDEAEDETRENEDDEEHEEENEEDDTDVEVERIEREVSEEEPISLELPALQEEEDDSDNDNDEKDDHDDENSKEDELEEDEEFLEGDDEPPPVVERITAPAGKPLPEVEDDEESSEKPPDTLEEEEEYEKQQEERKREEEQASHMWLKLGVGGALLVATQAVIRRATASRDEPESDEHEAREETPVIDRRMTLIPEHASKHVTPTLPEPEPPSTVEEVSRQIPSITKSAPTPQQTSLDDDDEEEIEEIEAEEEKEDEDKDVDKELYSEEEEVEEEEEVVPIKKEAPKMAAQFKPPTPTKMPTPTKSPTPTTPLTPPPTKSEEKKVEQEDEDEEVADDVEIIEDENEEEEEDEEEISDVDDSELLTRLEAKYGRLPEPERPAGYKPKDGGNSVEDDEWPGEPVESYWRQQLDALEDELRQGEWSRVAEKASAPELSGSARARFLIATALDRAAEEKRDNRLLSRAIAAYLNLLKMNENLSDKKLVQIANRTIDRIQFRGNYLNAEPVYRLLIRRFPNDVLYRNNLSISFLMANRGDLAEEVLKETLQRWPNDHVALAHYAFVLKTQHNKLEEAVKLFQKALEGDEGPACEPRFYYHLGDALLLLGRFKEAHEVHKRAAKHGHFLSPAQRSLYNVPRLKSQPWWHIEKTPYAKLARALERSWKEILKEGEAAKALYEKEKEGLKERGEWSQLDLFVRGMEIPGRCKRAPVTCSVVRGEVGAAGCRRGQVKFSAMQPGTHVRPHVGPTNCRLRIHLGLSNTKDTYLRVDQETRQWQEGKVLMFDDSFEHEVWHNGTGTRLVLIVDVWHPDLTAMERRTLTPI